MSLEPVWFILRFSLKLEVVLRIKERREHFICLLLEMSLFVLGSRSNRPPISPYASQPYFSPVLEGRKNAGAKVLCTEPVALANGSTLVPVCVDLCVCSSVTSESASDRRLCLAATQSGIRLENGPNARSALTWRALELFICSTLRAECGSPLVRFASSVVVCRECRGTQQRW